MCGRATLTNEDLNEMLRELGAEISADDVALFRPRFNIAPSDVHWILESRIDSDATHRALTAGRWGYLASGKPLINVRGEQVGSGAGFREAFRSRRCLMVTDGFFEWDKQRNPYWYHRPQGGLVLLAGLYQDAQDDRTTTKAPPRFTVLTTRPNTLVSQVHNRMPVIIPPARIDDWLAAPPGEVLGLISPAADDALVVTPVSRRVNSVRNDDRECLRPVPAIELVPNSSRREPRQRSLF